MLHRLEIQRSKSAPLASWNSALPLVILAWAFLPGLAGANPAKDPLGSLGDVVQSGIVCVALAAEVALVSFLVGTLCGADRRLPLIVSVTVLNIVSYAVFIRSVLPMVKNILLIESVIWLVEAIVILAIARSQTPRPVTMKGALWISLAGNMTSYFIGLPL